jgi:hypothetical protein
VPDYGRDLTFGYFLIPNAADPLLDTARDIEQRGLDWIGIQDHPYQRRFVDTWTLMGAIAAATTRVGFFPDVANLPLRPPAVLGKAAASLDVLSGGRFELALGAGSFWDAIEAYGGPRREPRDALAALEEAIQVIRLIWSGQRNLRFDGAHYRLAGAQSGRYRCIRSVFGWACTAHARCVLPDGLPMGGCLPFVVRRPSWVRARLALMTPRLLLAASQQTSDGS